MLYPSSQLIKIVPLEKPGSELFLQRNLDQNQFEKSAQFNKLLPKCNIQAKKMVPSSHEFRNISAYLTTLSKDEKPPPLAKRLISISIAKVLQHTSFTQT
jgi:hypothetical protein